MACVIIGRVFVIINEILNNERLYLINFIYSFAQGVTQFSLPFIIHTIVIQSMCFDHSILLFIGAITLHIIVVTILVTSPTISKGRRMIKTRGEKGAIELLKKNGEENLPIDLLEVKEEDESRRDTSAAASVVGEKSSKKISSYDFYPSDVLLSMDNMKWKNPCRFNNNEEDDEENKAENDDHFLEILDSNRVLNSDGVEILETIAEEADEEEIKLGIEDVTEAAAIKNGAIDAKVHRKGNSISNYVIYPFKSISSAMQRQIINPLRRALKIFKFYPSVILKSVDVFSYLLFITFILPNQVIKQQHRFKQHENVVFLVLITLMGVCWILYSIVVLKFHKALKQNFIHYFHLIGLVAKIFGYLCRYFPLFFFSHAHFLQKLLLLSLFYPSSRLFRIHNKKLKLMFSHNFNNDTKEEKER
jgi:competence protein ComGC